MAWRILGRASVSLMGECRGAEAFGVSDRGCDAGPAAVEDGYRLEESAVRGVMGEELEEEDGLHAGLAEVVQTVCIHLFKAAGLELHLQQDCRGQRLLSLELRKDGQAWVTYSAVQNNILFAGYEAIVVRFAELKE